MSDFRQSDLAKKIIDFHCPRFNELPNIDLYMDQVLNIITDTLSVFYVSENDKVLTASMVNNYVKQKVVSPPKNKKYSKHHVAYLFVVCILKQVFSIPEICNLIRIQINTYPIDQAYDYFCNELENALKAAFTTRNFELPNIAMEITPQTEIVRSGVLSFANKIYIQKFLQFCEKES